MLAGIALAVVGIAAGTPAWRVLASFHVSPSIQRAVHRLAGRTHVSVPGRRHALANAAHAGSGGGSIGEAVVVALVVLAALLLVWPFLRGFVRAFATRRPSTLQPASGVDAEPSPPASDEALGRHLDELVGQLAGGEARAAVIRSWLALEAFVQAGTRAGRAASETSAEFTRRLLRERAVDAGALDELHALFLAARFGRGGVDEPMRARAERCLLAMRRSIDFATPLPAS